MKAEDLLALRARPPEVGVETAARVAREVYGLEARITPLDGERDRNFRLEDPEGRRYVLKFIDREASDEVVLGQSAALAYLAARDPTLPVPRIIPTRSRENLARIGSGEARDVRVRLLTYLTGRPIQAFHPAGKSLLREVGRRVAQLDQALAGFFHPALHQPIVWDIRHAGALLPLVSDVHPTALRELVVESLRPLEELLARLASHHAQAIHGDCHGRNVLVDESGSECTGVIDLGDMIQAPLAVEVAVALAELLTDGVADLPALAELVSGYARAQELRRLDIELLFDSMNARIALGVLIQTWRSHHGGDPGTALMEASANALRLLLHAGKQELTRQWLEAAGVSSDLLRRRHFALGSNAELSYDRPLHLIRGEGVWLFTAGGERVLDVYNNVPHVGHAHPHVVEAISRQVALIASNTRYLDERIVEYSERLTATLPPELDSCLFVNSGSEANDIAWRMAKSHTGREGALVMKHAYHGITDAVTALSPAISAAVPSHVEQVAPPPAEDGREAIRRLAARGFGLAALMIDSAITSTGIFDPEREWAESLTRAVREAGGLVIGDEVQFGLGRSGSHFWGFERRGYQPDIVTLGKPVGNGYPLGVVITRRDILERFQRDTGFFSTFGGNPVAAAAGLAVLEVIEKERLTRNAGSTGGYFMSRLRALAGSSDRLLEVRGSGLMIGVEVGDRSMAKSLVNGLRERGVLIGSEGPLGNVLKLRPPLPFRPEHADIVIDALSATLSAVRP